MSDPNIADVLRAIQSLRTDLQTVRAESATHRAETAAFRAETMKAFAHLDRELTAHTDLRNRIDAKLAAVSPRRAAAKRIPKR